MDAKRVSRPRPYWRVDAKWVVGLLLILALNLAMLFYNLYLVTEAAPAVETMSTMLAVLTSPEGLDDATAIDAALEQLRANPDHAIRPFPGLPVELREADIAGRSPRELRLFVWRQLAEPLYREGLEGLMARIEDPEMRAGFAGGIGPLALFSLQAHQTLFRLLWIVLPCTLVLLALLILFSYRFGRLGSPGLVLFVASLPGAIISTALSRMPPADALLVGLEQDVGLTDRLGQVASQVLPPMMRDFSVSYTIVLLTGLALIIVAVLGGLIWRLTRRRVNMM